MTQANDAAAMFAAFMDFQRQQQTESVTSVTDDTDETTVTAMLASGRAKRKAGITVNKAAVREEATVAIDGDSLAALIYRAAKAADTADASLSELANAIADTHGDNWPDMVRAYRAGNGNETGKTVWDNIREPFLKACRTRDIGRVYWKRIMDSASGGRGTKEPKAFGLAVREKAEEALRYMLVAQREGHTLTATQSKIVSFLTDAAKLAGTDVEAFKVKCAKPRTVGVAKKS